MYDMEKLATDITSQTFSEDWLFHTLVIAITFLAGVSGAFISSYISRRAEQRAIIADFESIKSQLRETTTLTESIRSELHHHFDRAHAIEVLRRSKLEAYVEKINEATESLSREMNEKLFDSKEQYDASAYSTASMLQSIYLPEFDSVHSLYAAAYSEYRTWLADKVILRVERKQAGISSIPPQHEFLESYREKINNVLVSSSAIEERAREVGRKLIEIGSSSDKA